MVEAGRKSQTIAHVDGEGHALLALLTVVRIREVVLSAVDGERYSYGHRGSKLIFPAIVLKRVPVQSIVRVAAVVRCLVVGLDHCLVRVCVENCRKTKGNGSSVKLRGKEHKSPHILKHNPS